MLRLKISEASGWVDSRGTSRDPLDALTFLSTDSREALRANVRPEQFVVWDVGVLTDQRNRSSVSKPHSLIPDPVSVRTQGFAVGSMHTLEISRYLIPLWSDLLTILIGERVVRIFAADAFATEGHPDLQSLLRRHDVILEQTHTLVGLGTIYGATAMVANVAALLGEWWPSRVGLLAGLGLSPTGVMLPPPDYFPSGLTIRRHLPHLSHYFQTIRVYDNLGLRIVSRAADMEAVHAQLDRLGWRSGGVIATSTTH